MSKFQEYEVFFRVLFNEFPYVMCSFVRDLEEKRKIITCLQDREGGSPLGYLLGLAAFLCVTKTKALISS